MFMDVGKRQKAWNYEQKDFLSAPNQFLVNKMVDAIEEKE